MSIRGQSHTLTMVYNTVELSGSNTDGSVTKAVSSSFLSP